MSKKNTFLGLTRGQWETVDRYLVAVKVIVHPPDHRLTELFDAMVRSAIACRDAAQPFKVSSYETQEFYRRLVEWRSRTGKEIPEELPDDPLELAE